MTCTCSRAVCVACSADAIAAWCWAVRVCTALSSLFACPSICCCRRSTAVLARCSVAAASACAAAATVLAFASSVCSASTSVLRSLACCARERRPSLYSAAALCTIPSCSPSSAALATSIARSAFTLLTRSTMHRRILSLSDRSSESKSSLAASWLLPLARCLATRVCIACSCSRTSRSVSSSVLCSIAAAAAIRAVLSLASYHRACAFSVALESAPAVRLPVACSASRSLSNTCATALVAALSLDAHWSTAARASLSSSAILSI
mmetsp:Transcript_32049/g.95624  ORF Transcript_32049/g.95624 Transcript_32049/m.95624 type:complete len:265 (-) Transcript_32049:67-861(-)